MNGQGIKRPGEKAKCRYGSHITKPLPGIPRRKKMKKTYKIDVD